MHGRVLFARVGWMTFCNGVKEERPQGGGSYNLKNIGSELFNFRTSEKHVYGFVRGGKGRNAINLRCLDLTARKEASIDHVTVIFVAKHPTEGGQRVVGWYNDATVFAEKKRHPLKTKRKKNIEFCLKALASEACLLPTVARRVEVPAGKGAMGQSNVCYGDPRGWRYRKPWMKRIFDFAEWYSGPNLLTDPESETQQLESAEAAIEASGGFQTNPKIRRVVEKYAESIAIRHFEKLRFKVELRGKPFDLLCVKGDEKRFVEVKGTQTQGTTVALTRNEVDFLSKNAACSVLYVVHSIKVRKGRKYEAYSGKCRVVEPWNPSCGVLKPVTYVLRLHSVPASS